MFSFKQFSVMDDKCGMKVGTDGVMLGAWAAKGYESDINSVLDIGTGSGVVALMLAQRLNAALIKAIEIDEHAAEQATENFNNSPWKDCLSVECGDINEWSKKQSNKFDLIVSNPPYFRNSLLNPEQKRKTARHDDSLSLEQLFEAVAYLLSDNGSFVGILPHSEKEYISQCALDQGLFISRELNIRPTVTSDFKRLLFECKKGSPFEKESLDIVIEEARHKYTPDYINLTKEFYLKM